MELGIFFMPVHRPEKSWSQALAEDREAIILADELGYSEAWMGEHFSTKVEQVPAPLMFWLPLSIKPARFAWVPAWSILAIATRSWWRQRRHSLIT